ncbi:hypothetical protein, partial [Vibrio parahaemolyticus]|uniref:hypothetical protein n=1 Tax=Vibrio parahaemolyticus TaxID=670 RepID=UPI001CC264AF
MKKPPLMAVFLFVSGKKIKNTGMIFAIPIILMRHLFFFWRREQTLYFSVSFSHLNQSQILLLLDLF